jgi:hypothetical protein
MTVTARQLLIDSDGMVEMPEVGANTRAGRGDADGCRAKRPNTRSSFSILDQGAFRPSFELGHPQGSATKLQRRY